MATLNTKDFVITLQNLASGSLVRLADNGDIKEDVSFQKVESDDELKEYHENLVKLRSCRQIINVVYCSYTTNTIFLQGFHTTLDRVCRENYADFFASERKAEPFHYHFSERLKTYILELLEGFTMMWKLEVKAKNGALPESIVFLNNDRECLKPTVTQLYGWDTGDNSNFQTLRKLIVNLMRIVRQTSEEKGCTIQVEYATLALIEKNFVNLLTKKNLDLEVLKNHPALFRPGTTSRYVIEATRWVEWMQLIWWETSGWLRIESWFATNVPGYTTWQETLEEASETSVFLYKVYGERDTDYPRTFNGLFRLYRNTYTHLYGSKKKLNPENSQSVSPEPLILSPTPKFPSPPKPTPLTSNWSWADTVKNSSRSSPLPLPSLTSEDPSSPSPVASGKSPIASGKSPIASGKSPVESGVTQRRSNYTVQKAEKDLDLLFPDFLGDLYRELTMVKSPNPFNFCV